MMQSQPRYTFDPYRQSLVPKEYREATLEDIDSNDKKEIFTKAMEGKSFYLYGSAGTGKSFVSFLVFKYMTGKFDDIPGACSSHEGVVYISFPSIMAKFESMNFDDKKEACFRLEKAKASDFLMIDEFSPEGLNDAMKRQTYVLINERFVSRRQTIITSNYSLEEIEQKTDPRISSRIGGMCNVFELNGPDRRLSKGVLK